MDIVSFLIGYESGASAGGVVTDVDAMLDEINGENINGMIVTFVGVDGTVLHEEVVTPGFDCPNPKIPTPTKESTVANVFTFNGWSLVDGGEADENALKKVTAHRTVYAAFEAGTRYYTVKFYDDTGKLVNTESVAYMGSSTYVHKKTGADFQGWNPEPVNIEGNMSCYGSWIYASFAADSWETIVQRVNNGKAAEYYSIGDERDIELTTSAGTEKIVVQIVGFDVETYVTKPDGKLSYNSMSIVAKTPPVGSLMKYRATAYSIVDGGIEAPMWRGFAMSDILTYLNETVLPGLPADLQSVLCETDKIYSHYNVSTSAGLRSDDFKLWIPSLMEVRGNGSGNLHGNIAYDAYNRGTSSAFDNDARESRVATLYGNDTGVSWWLRTVVGNDSNSAWVVNEDGSIGKSRVMYDSHYVVFGFCV